MRGSPIVLVVLVCLAALATVPAQAQVPDLTHFALERESAFETGCFGPCKCPVLTEPLRGTFDLQRTQPDPLFDHYDVTNLHWELPSHTPPVQITGSGTYRVGGEFAIQQQLSLDLEVGDQPVRHYDSGLVLGGGTIKLDVTISLHGMTTCFDTVMRVVASPAVAEVPPGPQLGPSAARPNPFRARTEIDFSLGAPGAAEVVVYDASGRAVRTLAAGARFAAGPHALVWDGRRDDGSTSPPGLYFVRIRAGGRESLLRVARLK